MPKLFFATVAAIVVSVTVALAHGPHEHGAGTSHATTDYGEAGDPSQPSRVVVIEMKEADGRMLFEPARITVRQGEQITFSLSNVGALEHEFLIGTQTEIEDHAELMKAMPEMQHDDPNAKRLAARTSGDLVWRFTKAGEFDFACLIPGHREAGMTGRIVVQPRD